MTLITKEVWVILCGSNYKYWEDLGYDIPRRIDSRGRFLCPKNSKILVKTKDLPSFSNVLIDYSCDNCGKVNYGLNYFDCFRHIREDGKTFCVSCSHKLYSSNNATKTKLSKSISFERWCINNNRQDVLDRWDYENNQFRPSDISYSSNKKAKFICPNNTHESELKSINKISGRNQETIVCIACDSFEFNYPDFLFLWSDKNKKTPSEYQKYSNSKIWWKCNGNKHADYFRKIGASVDANFNCPSCVRERGESFLQEKVRLYLDELCNEYNWTLNHERNCSLKCVNYKTKNILPYDNEIVGNDFNLMVEVHGEQHYDENKWHIITAKRKNTTPEEELEYQQWKDEYKKQYALSQGYFYLAIPYWEDDKQETWKQSIDNKLNEIYYYLENNNNNN